MRLASTRFHCRGAISSESQVGCQGLQMYSWMYGMDVLIESKINDHFLDEGLLTFLSQTSYLNSVFFFIVNMFISYKDLIHFNPLLQHYCSQVNVSKGYLGIRHKGVLK